MKSMLSLFTAIVTAMVGYTIHGSIFWSIVDLFVWPLAIMKWLIYHELTLDVLKRTFSWFF
jgi:hypothetical protein